MSYERVEQASKTIIGTKQAVKAIRAGQVIELFVALDADSWVTDPVIVLAKEVGVPVSLVESKRTWQSLWYSCWSCGCCNYCKIVFV